MEMQGEVVFLLPLSTVLGGISEPSHTGLLPACCWGSKDPQGHRCVSKTSVRQQLGKWEPGGLPGPRCLSAVTPGADWRRSRVVTDG